MISDLISNLRAGWLDLGETLFGAVILIAIGWLVVRVHKSFWRYRYKRGWTSDDPDWRSKHERERKERERERSLEPSRRISELERAERQLMSAVRRYRYALRKAGVDPDEALNLPDPSEEWWRAKQEGRLEDAEYWNRESGWPDAIAKIKAAEKDKDS